MEVQLPSGGTAEFREVLQRADTRNARKGIVIVIGADGSRRIDGSMQDVVVDQLIRRMLIRWPFGPLPSEAQSDDLAMRMLDQLDDDDYQALADAVEPWVRKVNRRGSAVPQFTHVPTGVLVEPADPAQAAALAAHPDFTRADDGEDPKSGSRPTGTSSSASRELTGPTSPDGTPPTST